MYQRENKIALDGNDDNIYDIYWTNKKECRA